MMNLPLTKIDIGFSNDLFAVGESHILKMGKQREDAAGLAREVRLCKLLSDSVPVPEVVYHDTTMEQMDMPFVLYKRIHGDNLYAVWHSLSNQQRQSVVQQICDVLKAITIVAWDEPAPNWRNKIRTSIEYYLTNVRDRKLLPADVLNVIEDYVDKHEEALDEEQMALTFYDAHFDNFLVSGDKLVGVLDLERTEMCSIDYGLDLVRRMERYPTKYVCSQFEHLIKTEDYASLLDLYRPAYPALFDFKDLDVRLNLYSIEHGLSDVFHFSDTYSTAKTEIMDLYEAIR